MGAVQTTVTTGERRQQPGPEPKLQDGAQSSGEGGHPQGSRSSPGSGTDWTWCKGEGSCCREGVSNSCDPMDDGPPGSSVYGISQARNWSGFPFSSLRKGNIPANSTMPTVPIWLGEGVSQDMDLPVKNQESSAQPRASGH